MSSLNTVCVLLTTWFFVHEHLFKLFFLIKGLSSLTSNVSKWTLFAKDNVVKYGSKAAEKATELTKTVNEKVKEGNLLSSVQTGVSSVTSKVGNISTKAWSDLWSTNKNEYNSIPSSQSTYGTENSYLGNSRDDDYNGNSENKFKTSSSYTKLSDSNFNKNYNSSNSNNNNNTKQQKQDDWNWQDESSWGTGDTTKNQQQKNKSNNNKTNLIDFDSPKVEDNWADDDDNWEPIEQVKPKAKK